MEFIELLDIAKSTVNQRRISKIATIEKLLPYRL